MKENEPTIKSLHYRLNIGINAALKLEKFFDGTPEKYGKVLIPKKDLQEVVSNLFLSFEPSHATIEELKGLRRNYGLLNEAYKLSVVNEAMTRKGANNGA